MARTIRLPAIVPEDELRITHETEGPLAGSRGDYVVSSGNRSLQRALFDALCGPRVFVDRMKLAGLVGFHAMAEYVTDDPSIVAFAETVGYDPHSLVVSIRRRDTPDEPVPDDLRGCVESAQEDIVAASNDMDEWREAHGVYIVSETERDALSARLSAIQDKLESLLHALGRKDESHG